MDSEGRCVVPNFTVGRRGYGNVYFDKELDVSGLNLDEICHFRNKEIILYQDDENKPPLGEGLNQPAQVTFDKIWPQDKHTHEPITDPERLEKLHYEEKLRKICVKKGTKFLEYRPETGSCVFEVKHFSKYTMDDVNGESESTKDIIVVSRNSHNFMKNLAPSIFDNDKIGVSKILHIVTSYVVRTNKATIIDANFKMSLNERSWKFNKIVEELKKTFKIIVSTDSLYSTAYMKIESTNCMSCNLHLLGKYYKIFINL